MSTNVIVVGVDGSEGGRRALRWAVGEAHRTEAAVRAVTAWTWDGTPSAGAGGPTGQRRRAEAICAREVASVAAELGTAVPIVHEVAEGPADRVLTDAARDARMLVLGRHGYGHVHYSLLGSVSAACIRRSTCPVVVVPSSPPALDPYIRAGTGDGRRLARRAT
jgi:nucleotide-binding universal stress UspA family protein